MGEVHGLPKTHKTFSSLSKSRPITDTTNTLHYNVGKFLSSLLNLLTINEFLLSDSFDAVTYVKNIPKWLFVEGYPFVSFDVESLFTNVPLSWTVDIILDRIYNDNLISTTLKKCTLKKLILDCCSKTAFSFDNQLYKQTDGVSMGLSLEPVLANIILTEFEHVIISDIISSSTIQFYKRYVDDTIVLIKPSDIPMVLAKFNEFLTNLKFTVDTFPDGVIHFWILKSQLIALTFIARTCTPTNIPTSPVLNLFSHKTAWIKLLFNCVSKIYSTKKLFDNQIDTLKSFMSWNGYPIGIRNFLINKLKLKYKSSPSTTIVALDVDLPRAWVRLRHLGKHSESLVKSCVSKIRRCRVLCTSDITSRHDVNFGSVCCDT